MSTTHIEQIKSRIDIVAFIGEYITTKPAGSNFKALCPFHNEKNPSFMISASKQIFKCFGCGKSGDIFTFLEEYEGISFGEALKILATRAQVQLPRFDPKANTKENQLYDCMRAAGAFYQYVLAKQKEAEQARVYIRNRGVDELTRDVFKIGWSPLAWDALYNFLRKKGFPDSCILETGLTTRKEKGYYDKFRKRLMFPIGDVYGRIIGFGGRIIIDDSEEAKYINSQNTSLYNKSKVLYGLDKAKDAIRKTGSAIIVEGYMDVIGSHMAGVDNVVAASGTALTQEQLTLLKRFTDTVVFAFDMDDAGINGVLRSYPLAVSLGMNTKIVQLPHGKDPFDVAKEDPLEWKRVVNKGEHILDFYLRIVLDKVNISTLEGKKYIRRALLPIISAIPDMLEKTHYREKLAQLLNIPFDDLLLKKQEAKPLRKSGSKEKNGAISETARKSRIESAVEHLLALFCKYPYKTPTKMSFPHVTFRGERLNTLYTVLQAAYTTGKKVSEEDMRVWRERHQIIIDECSLLADKDYENMDDRSIQLEFNSLSDIVKEHVMKIKRGKLIGEIRRAEERGDENEAEKVSSLLDTLQ